MTLVAARQGRRLTPPGAAEPPLRLLIVDDSQVARAVLSRMIASFPEFEVVGLAASAEDALQTLRACKVDIILLDIELPGASGLEALPDILKAGQGARVLVVSSMAEAGADAAVRALALGAADTLPKPGSNSLGGRFSEVLADRLRRIGRARREHAKYAPAQDADHVVLRAAPEGRLGCIAIGASTGGLHAINDFLKALPARIGVPILVTQHLPATFMPYFARQLSESSGRRTSVAVDGDALLPDHIHVAPGTAHIGLSRRGATVRIRLSDEPAASGCLPSVDPMLVAVAEAYGAGGAAVILSGMGRDGVLGGRNLADAGGVIFAQDPDSASIWGMPRAVAEAGLASAVLPPREIAARVAARAEGASWT